MPNYLEARPLALADTECYPNYWSIEFRCATTGRTKLFEHSEQFNLALDRNGIASMFKRNRVITMNGNHYDIPMILYAMQGATNEQLKQANDNIIMRGMKSWEFMDHYGLTIPSFFDHIDLWEVTPAAPQMIGLKGHAGRLHSKHILELPFDPMEPLTWDQIATMRSYVGNDTLVTKELWDELKDACSLRALMSDVYGVDVRSKSDAQVAEAVIKKEVERITGKRVYKSDSVHVSFKYVPPAYIKFETPELNAMLDELLRHTFRTLSSGYVQKKDFEVLIGGKPYQMGIGGLHSKEKSVSYYSTDGITIRDRDVTGYYPNMIIASGRYPANMGPAFQSVFQSIVNVRTLAKKESKRLADLGDAPGAKQWTKLAALLMIVEKLMSIGAEVSPEIWANIAESMKIMTNGIFGKTGSPFSVVYAPELMIYTTLTGQLSILMLIEQCVLRGWEVVSANTDGFVTLVPDDKYDYFRWLIMDWEWESGLETEETVYKSLHSRDVNNYLAVKEEKGKIKFKRKGEYGESGRGVKGGYGVKKNPNMDISTQAVMKFIEDNTPVEKTVRECTDIRAFVVVQRVAEGGGAFKDGVRIGKWIRYYYGTDTPGPILNGAGGRVGSSDGACPCMTLPDEMPDNIDYARYEREAYAILNDLAVVAHDPDHVGRRGETRARLPDQKNIHTINAGTGVALCGLRKKSLREPWIEFGPAAPLPTGHKHCKKCREAEL